MLKMHLRKILVPGAIKLCGKPISSDYFQWQVQGDSKGEGEIVAPVIIFNCEIGQGLH